MGKKMWADSRKSAQEPYKMELRTLPCRFCLTPSLCQATPTQQSNEPDGTLTARTALAYGTVVRIVRNTGKKRGWYKASIQAFEGFSVPRGETCFALHGQCVHMHQQLEHQGEKRCCGRPGTTGAHKETRSILSFVVTEYNSIIPSGDCVFN